MWLSFRGGKGVATLLGVLSGAVAPAAVYAAVWIALLLVSGFHRSRAWPRRSPRRSSPCPQFTLSPDAARFRVLVLWKHRENILRLRKGTEPRIRSTTSLDRLRLVRTVGIGPVTYRQLIARFGSAGAALSAVPDLARRGGGRAPKLYGRDDADARSRGHKLGGKWLALGQGLYPRLLAEMEDAPPLLTAKGNLNLLDRQSVALVGARNASAAACRFARGLAYDLGQRDLVVVSGLARGIDSAAHDGALESGTIAVIAGGIDIAYPPETRRGKDHRRTRPGAGRDAARDRAARPPFPLPQPDHRRPGDGNDRGRGGAALGLADHRAAGGGSGARGDGGARLAARPAGAGLQPADPRRRDADPECRRRGRGDPRAGEPGSRSRCSYEAPAESNGDDALGVVEQLLGPSPAPVDEIIRLSGAPSGAVQMALLELDLAGRLDRHAGGKVSLRPA